MVGKFFFLLACDFSPTPQSPMQLLYRGRKGRGRGLFSISFGQCHPSGEVRTQAAKHGKLIPYANLAQTQTRAHPDNQEPRTVNAMKARLAQTDHPKMLLKFRNLQ